MMYNQYSADDDPTPPPPENPQPPRDDPPIPLPPSESMPMYKNVWFWISVVSIIVATVFLIMYMRSKKGKSYEF